MNDENIKMKNRIIAVAALVLIPLLFGLGYLVGTIFTKPVQSNSQIERQLQQIIENEAMYGKTYEQETIMHAKLLGMVSLLNDRYAQITYDDGDTTSSITRNQAENRKIGITFQFNSLNQLLVISVDPNSDSLGKIFPNDLIIGVFSNLERQYFQGKTQEEVTALLKSKPGIDSIDLIIQRGNQILTPITILYKELNTDSSSIVSSKKIDDNTVYLKLKEFDETAGELFKREMIQINIDNPTKLILDLRGNPGGYLSTLDKIVQELVPLNSSKNFGTVFQAVHTKRKEVSSKITGNGRLTPKNYTDNIVVLVDQNTASAAESLASILKIQLDAQIVGKKTFGKDIYQATVRIGTSNYYVKYTEGNWFYANEEGKFVTIGQEKILDEDTVINDFYLNDFPVLNRHKDIKVTLDTWIDLKNERLFLEYLTNSKIESLEELNNQIKVFSDKNNISYVTDTFTVKQSEALFKEYIKRVSDLENDAYIKYALALELR
ncbi:Peptidase, S41 family [Alteracholeplasma palmae J233]|uniref:Peptidase, S41 family n=1 Tax=Alteracholeplasma palmae (strain ATCC 49389 / J233) TaxID=1318466 RepID=U4KKF5_ALTPJ|nr:S41 family peptidase [Alteracholeplasma palmae]CCV64043.1 Peptidase, S41 family [Alteracholeplasma palmae J233]